MRSGHGAKGQRPINEQRAMPLSSLQLARRYRLLWREAIATLRQGQVAIDPHLRRKAQDQRRGLSVILRLDQAVTAQVTSMLQQLATCEPDQYYYHPSELHVTVLSLFTAGTDTAPRFAQLPDYLATLQPILATASALRISFRGISASPGAVMIQGFPQPDTLNPLRDRLRQALQAAGMSDGVDGRYRLQTAHATVMRFQAPLQHSATLLELLQRYRRHSFGQTLVQQLQLVEHDWYMSTEKVRVLAAYDLR